MNQSPGGIWVRFLAAVIDALILGTGLWFVNWILAAVLVFATGIDIQNPVVSFALFCIELLIDGIGSYFYYMHFYLRTGATPGKKVFNLKVVHFQDGELLTKRQVIQREVVGKPISGLILGIGYLIALFRKDKRALHDLMADSRVIRIDEGTGVSV